MKYFLILFFTFNIWAKDKTKVVLSVWNTMGMLKVTPGLVSAGLELGLKTSKSNIELVTVDTDGSFENVTSKLRTAIIKYKPVAIIGGITSNMSLFISKVAEEQKIPFITPFATLSSLTEAKKFTFRTCWNDNQQSKAIINLIEKDQGLKNGVVIYNSLHSYSIGLKDLFLKNTENRKLNIFKTFEIKKSSDLTSDFIKEIKTLNVDFIFLPSYQTEAASIIKKLAPKLGSKIKYFGGDSWGGGRLFHEMVSNLSVSFNGFYTQHYSLENDTKENRDFKKFLVKYKVMDRFSGVKKMTTTAMKAPIAVGYDLVRFLSMAFTQKETDLVKAITKTYYKGATGAIKINKNNGPSNKALYIYKIDKNGESFYRSIL